MRHIFLLPYLSLTLFMCTLPLGPVHAEGLPPGTLEKDYKNCMGDETPETNAQRAEYCACVMDQMKSWDAEEYGTAASEQAKTGDKATARIEALAKTCIQKVLK